MNARPPRVAAKAATWVETAMFSSRGDLVGGWDVCVLCGGGGWRGEGVNG